MTQANQTQSTQTPPNQYVDIRAGGYYVAGTRIGLDLVIEDFRRGRSPEAIFDAYPVIGSLAKVYGAITFFLDHPTEIDAYLDSQRRLFEDFRIANPLPQDMAASFERGRAEVAVGRG